MASRSTNTMREFVERLVQDLAQAQTLADADLPFLLGLQGQCIEWTRDPQKKLAEQGLVPNDQQQPPPPMQGAPQGPPPGGGGMPGFAAGGGRGGVMPGAPAPNSDELTRLLSKQ